MIRAVKFIRLFRILFGRKEIEVGEIERMGLLAVKIAQMYAVRSDLLSLEKCAALQSLYERVTPISWEQFDAVLSEHASERFTEEVEQIQKEPLATASLGQVHAARLSCGQKVVVKVIKTDAIKNFHQDLRAVRLLGKIAITFYPKLKRLADPVGTIDTIARLTLMELDLLNEEKGTQRLKELRDKAEGLDHLSTLQFPHIYTELSTSKVLVTERLMFPSVGQGIDSGNFIYDHLLHLFRVHGYFLFLKGEFHGDLHQGNVFFNEGKLWFIDNANVEVVNPTFSQGLLQFLAKLGEQDFLGAAEVMEQLSITPPKNREKYRRDFQALYADFESGKSSLTTQMMNTIKLCIHAGMEFPEGAFPVIKSLMYLDGMVLSCAPEAKLLEDVLEYLDDLT